MPMKLTSLATAICRAPHRTLVALRQAGKVGRKQGNPGNHVAVSATGPSDAKKKPDFVGGPLGEREHATVERGRGSPLIMLHGLMGEADNWGQMMSHLPGTFHSIALRLPFFQDGSKLNTISAITDYAREYIENADLPRRMALGGNSLGGHVALHLAMDMPDRVAGLILTGSSGLFEREMGRPQGANPSREWIHGKLCEIFYDPIMVTDDLISGVQAVLAGRQYKRTLVSIAKSAKRDNLADILGSVRCPVLLIWGKQDEITPPEVAKEFMSLLPNCELAWLNKCGHAPMLEQPKGFAKAVAKWWHRCGLDKLLAEDLRDMSTGRAK